MKILSTQHMQYAYAYIYKTQKEDQTMMTRIKFSWMWKLYSAPNLVIENYIQLRITRWRTEASFTLNLGLTKN